MNRLFKSATAYLASIILSLSTLGSLFISAYAESYSKVWIGFKDKGVITQADFASLAGQVELSEHALKRRAKAGRGIEMTDLPVNPAYIERIEPLVVQIHRQSRWLNAVSATVLESKTAEIAALDFVSEIQPVAQAAANSRGALMTEICWQGIEDYSENMETQGVEGSLYGKSYDQLNQIQVIEAHRRGYYGEGVFIAVIDGGFMLDHRGLAHLDVIGEWDFINNDPFTGYDPLQDSKGQPTHGTGCMSTIGCYDPGNLIGAAPFASFILAKSEDVRDETPIEEDNWVAAVEWCEAIGADIVSSSLSYSDWYSKGDFDGIIPYASRAADFVFELGVVICTSMGNSGPYPVTLGAPADAEGVLAIGAVDSIDNLTRFSSRGPSSDGRIKPNICALGRHVTAVRPYSYDQFALWNGTSLSCPLAAGGIALVIEAHPDWPSWRVVEAVENTGTHAEYPDNEWGHGILQVVRAIDYPAIECRVISKSEGKPIAGAYLQITSADTNFIVTLDNSGVFYMPNLEYGSYRIKADAPDYLDEKLTLRIPPEHNIDIQLERWKKK